MGAKHVVLPQLDPSSGSSIERSTPDVDEPLYNPNNDISRTLSKLSSSDKEWKKLKHQSKMSIVSKLGTVVIGTSKNGKILLSFDTLQNWGCHGVIFSGRLLTNQNQTSSASPTDPFRGSKLYAFKVVDLNETATSESCDLTRPINEAQVLSTCDHPNIIRLVNTIYTPPSQCTLIMDYCVGSVLKLAKDFAPLPESLVAYICSSVLSALDYLHDGAGNIMESRIHRDIKASNILMNDQACVLLADFGVSTIVLKGGTAKSVQGTPGWMAAEALSGDGSGCSSDIWSLGVTTLEILTGRSPPFHTGEGEFAIEVSQELYEFLASCLNTDPSLRPSAKDLLMHRFLNKSKSPKNYKDMFIELSKLKRRERKDEGSIRTKRSIKDLVNLLTESESDVPIKDPLEHIEPTPIEIFSPEEECRQSPMFYTEPLESLAFLSPEGTPRSASVDTFYSPRTSSLSPTPETPRSPTSKSALEFPSFRLEATPEDRNANFAEISSKFFEAFMVSIPGGPNRRKSDSSTQRSFKLIERKEDNFD